MTSARRHDHQLDYALLDAIFEHSGLGIALWDTSFRFLRVNETLARTFDSGAARQLVGRHLADVVPALWESARPLLEQVVATGRAGPSTEVATTAPTGEEHVWLVSCYPVFEGDGDDSAVVAVAAITHDVTDRHQLQHRAHEEAHSAAREYRRALRDYTQLTRHRLANPLTAITAGIATLRDLELGLDRETRLQVLDVMGETARRLEQAILHPELVGEEEHELLPTPQLSDAEVARVLENDAVKAEQHFRDINQAMLTALPDRLDEVHAFFCECWAMDCTSTVEIALRDYFSIHARDDQFVICPGHNLPSVEHVVDRRASSWVVRKYQRSLEAAAEDMRDVAPPT